MDLVIGLFVQLTEGVALWIWKEKEDILGLRKRKVFRAQLLMVSNQSELCKAFNWQNKLETIYFGDFK